MTAPRKHHFIPACYLKQWAGADGRVCEYKRVLPGKIVPHRRHPNATGYETNLYRLEGLPDALAQSVETELMKPIDTDADLGLQKILKYNSRPWNERERSALTRFILSLRYRHPEGMREITAHMHDLHVAGLGGLRDHYAQWRQPQHPPTLAEYVAREWPAREPQACMKMLWDIIHNENAIRTINNMHWSTVSLQHSGVPLLTSDLPLDMLGLARADAYIALPVSPHVLFVAGHNDVWAKVCAAKPPEEVVEMINQAVVAQARKTVWGTDDSQLAFVEKWMSQTPPQALIPPAQKVASIAAAFFDTTPPTSSDFSNP